jgi:hypothetical protein
MRDLPSDDGTVESDDRIAMPPPTQGLGGDAFPDPRVYSHTGETFHFHRDLVLGRVAVINFMSILQHPLFPVTEHLLRLAERLGPRLGSEVHFYSVSMDSEHDRPRQLRAFAEGYGVPPGWLLLTGASDQIDALSRRLFKNGALCGYRWGHPARLVHYGNGSAGLWGAFPADGDVDLNLRRLSSVAFGKPLEGPPRRAGPRLLIFAQADR